MQNLDTVLDRLDRLIDAVGRAQDEFQFAALYGAIRFALDDLEGILPAGYTYPNEKIAEIRWNITAAVGYEAGSSFTQKQHLLWAVDSLSKLSSVLRSGAHEFSDKTDGRSAAA